jgi:YVTN family beta-propeller protein
LVSACTKTNPETDNGIGFMHGAYITNEGAFGNSNGSVSYFDTDSTIMINHIFENVNGRPLGDVVQSVAIAGEKGFIVVNNSQKMEVVDLETFESIGSIDSLEYPRFFLAVNDQKGYLTDGNFIGCVYVIDLKTLKITDTIPCGSGPEKMIAYNNSVLVANCGGWGNDSTITVIDSRTDQVSATWRVGLNPVDMVLDKANQLWILGKGKVVWNMDWTIGEETSSTLTMVDPGSGLVKKTIAIGLVGDFFWPQRLGINRSRDRIYFLESGGIYGLSIHSSSFESKPVVPGSLYGFGIDPVSDVLYTLFAPSFTTSGWMIRYTTSGSKIDSLEVGIGPSQIVFN